MYPLVETVHVLGIMLFAGTIAMVDLRLLGRAFTDTPVSEMTSRILPWTVAGFAVMAVTGALLFYAIPVRTYHSVWFRLKLVLLVGAAINIWLFHRRVQRDRASMGSREEPAARRADIGGDIARGLGGRHRRRADDRLRLGRLRKAATGMDQLVRPVPAGRGLNRWTSTHSSRASNAPRSATASSSRSGFSRRSRRCICSRSRMLGGAVLMLDLRLLGAGLAAQAPAAIEKQTRPWLIGAICALIATGVPLALSEALKLYGKEAFWVKMVALCIGARVHVRGAQSVRAPRSDGWRVQQDRCRRIHRALAHGRHRRALDRVFVSAIARCAAAPALLPNPGHRNTPGVFGSADSSMRSSPNTMTPS